MSEAASTPGDPAPRSRSALLAFLLCILGGGVWILARTDSREAALGIGVVLIPVALIVALELVSTLVRRRGITRRLNPGEEVHPSLLGGSAWGVIEGRSFRLNGSTIEVEISVLHPATLGRRELEEIAGGLPSPRTGTLAVNPEHREAVAALVASGRETILFLEPRGVRFQGYERGPIAPLVRALLKLAGPGFHISRHAGPSACPYCKESVTEASRACDVCHAEHHAECFAEHGGCAIFGCSRAPISRRAKASG